jgi:hypothetical protein
VIRRLLPFLAVCLVSPVLWGQTVSQVVFLPQTYYIGDVVEARAIVRVTESLDLVPPTPLPQTDWVDIHSVVVVQRADGYEVRVTFQPFFVGTRQLPPIDLGSMTLTGVSAVVQSLSVEEGPLELQPVRDQLLLPGTQALIAVFLLLLVGVPVVIILTGGWARRWIENLRERYRASRPYRTLTRGLRQLQTELHDLDGKGYYIRLLDLARAFLGGRFGPRFRSATTGELDQQLRRVGIDPELRKRLVALFQFGDLVKFAGRRVTVDDRTHHLEEVRTIAVELRRQERGESQRVGA